MPGTLVGAEEMAVNKTDKSICLHGTPVSIVVAMMVTTA